MYIYLFIKEHILHNNNKDEEEEVMIPICVSILFERRLGEGKNVNRLFENASQGLRHAKTK